MSDFVTVYSQGRKYDCDTFLITPKWQTQGNLASVECEFECATVVKKIGRGYIIKTKEILTEISIMILTTIKLIRLWEIMTNLNKRFPML